MLGNGRDPWYLSNARYSSDCNDKLTRDSVSKVNQFYMDFAHHLYMDFARYPLVCGSLFLFFSFSVNKEGALVSLVLSTYAIH